jgi:hypothetical protein
MRFSPKSYLGMGQWKAAGCMPRLWSIAGKCFIAGIIASAYNLRIMLHLQTNAPLVPQGWAAGVGRLLDGRGGMSGVYGANGATYGAFSFGHCRRPEAAGLPNEAAVYTDYSPSMPRTRCKWRASAGPVGACAGRYGGLDKAWGAIRLDCYRRDRNDRRE